MTTRLYYSDSYRTEFTATIVDRTNVNGQPAVILDQTGFYPTSGGQAHDTGQLGKRRVVDVVAREDGTVLHVLDRALAADAAGQTIHGTIDWPRRYDHMQQHSGQHLLSYVFHARLGGETVSVHFGTTESTLDIVTATATEMLTDEQLAAVERRANELVYANLPITAYFAEDNRIAQLPVRRPPTVHQDIRIVEIDGLDYAACGGTHCRRTGELGPVTLLRQARSRGRVRITFLCGWRALHDYRTKQEVAQHAAATFSTEIPAVPAALERTLEQNRALQRRIDALTEQLLQVEARELWQSARAVGDYALVVQTCMDKTPDEAKTLVSLLQTHPHAVILLSTTTDTKLTLFFARGDDVPLHMGDVLRDVLGTFGGKGGGRPEFAQGGGVPGGDAEQVLAHARHRVRSLLGRADSLD